MRTLPSLPGRDWPSLIYRISKIDQIHSKIMKYIIAFLLTVALLCFSIVTGRAERPTQLPSGTYYLSIRERLDGRTEEPSGAPHHQSPRKRSFWFDKTEIVIEEILADNQISLFGKLVGHTMEIYADGKMTSGDIALAMTKFMDGM